MRGFFSAVRTRRVFPRFPICSEYQEHCRARRALKDSCAAADSSPEAGCWSIYPWHRSNPQAPEMPGTLTRGEGRNAHGARRALEGCGRAPCHGSVLLHSPLGVTRVDAKPPAPKHHPKKSAALSSRAGQLGPGCLLLLAAGATAGPSPGRCHAPQH